MQLGAALRSVLLGVRVIVVQLYCLKVNGRTVCEVTSEVPSWLPIRPKLDRKWLRQVVAQAIGEYFCPRNKFSSQGVVTA